MLTTIDDWEKPAKIELPMKYWLQKSHFRELFVLSPCVWVSAAEFISRTHVLKLKFQFSRHSMFKQIHPRFMKRKKSSLHLYINTIYFENKKRIGFWFDFMWNFSNWIDVKSEQKICIQYEILLSNVEIACFQALIGEVYDK